MVVSETNKKILLQTPKCASSTISQIFQETYKDSRHIGGHEPKININLINGNLNDYYKILPIRNPYSKLVSFWWTIKDSKDHMRFNSGGDFNSFIKTLNKYMNSQQHTIPQYHYYEGNEINKIIRYENLLEDIKSMDDFKNINELPHINPASVFSKREKPYMDFYNKESVIIVNNLYSKDFELFKYEKK